jgi:hypothetical protein
MTSDDDVYHLPEMVLRLSKYVRHCTVIDRYGNTVASLSRKNLQPLLTNQDGDRQALEVAMRYFKTPSWARNLGKMHYTASRYEKVIGSVIPLTNNYIMLVAFDYNANGFDTVIMKKIMPIVKRIFKTQV